MHAGMKSTTLKEEFIEIGSFKVSSPLCGKIIFSIHFHASNHACCVPTYVAVNNFGY